uniref:DSP-PTPase phosphatase fused to NAD+ Kinase domain-containing protein n=1 Tax=Oryza rufipogon TaxID=4529 RepID=A0A0E0R552_ORYRU
MPDIMQVSQGLMVIPVQRYFQIGFRGGQFSGEKLEWLLSKGFKIIVDLWEEDVKDDLYLLAVQEAVSLGKIEVVNIPVEIGTAPSAKQVQRLTEVVSDSVKKPIYLHCQEGNETVDTQNGSLNWNGKPVKNDQTDQLTNSPGFSSEGSKNSTSSLSAEQNEPLTINQLRFYGLEKLGHPLIVTIFYQLLLVLLMENHPAMEPPHLLRKGHLMPAILKAIVSLDHKNLLKGTKIVKYLLACMPLPSTFFLDGRELVIFYPVIVLQCRVLGGFIPTALTWEEEEADTLGQAGAGKKRLTGPRQKGGKETVFPLQLMHLKEGSDPYLPKIECYEHNHLITKVEGDEGDSSYTDWQYSILWCSWRLNGPSKCPMFAVYSNLPALIIPDDARSNVWVSFDGKRRQQLSRVDCSNIHESAPTPNYFEDI